MSDNRIRSHPVLPVPQREAVTIYWNKEPVQALRDEVISSALIAAGIHVFGHHHNDGSAQGIYCANGQCAKCTVIANGVPVKACMTKVQAGMMVQSVEGLPALPEATTAPNLSDIQEVEVDVLVIGGGPAGLSAAVELGRLGVRTLIIDDKSELGGKLVLQTHKFFGSVEDSYAGARGNEIGRMLARQALDSECVETWTDATALYVFKDRKVGVLHDGRYRLVTPKIVLNAAGAREKFLRFAGNTLSGIYGAGAFQTLVNRDLVRPTRRLFIVGGGNVGLIAGYHALQAGIEVAGLVEAMPQCGGYRVHADKLRRLGVPIHTSHTVLCANGEESVESVTIARIDENFASIAGTEQTFICDTLLIAVGLNPVDEFTREAEKAGLPVVAAGDADEIAEASSAMFMGRIAGLRIARDLVAGAPDIPASLSAKADILKAHPGCIDEQEFSTLREGVYPVLHCLQEIPCNPCSTVCPTNAIHMKGDPILGNPYYEGSCVGCGKCVAICPGLAITLVDYRKDRAHPTVTVPYELSNHPVQPGSVVTVVDISGHMLDSLEVAAVVTMKENMTQLVRFKAPANIAAHIVNFIVQPQSVSRPLPQPTLPTQTPDDAMVCLCERVTVGEVRALIRKGVRDINQLKAITRIGMGPCGAKTCDSLVRQVFREEGIPPERIVENTSRPVFVEVPFGVFAAGERGSHE
ncbi:MAG: FAD-dependent oxidoreductase [Candidatus Cloacimonetes bacterium]|nr:FAD-dependent oxidoreductase [Candidatus Cloacimonadota bacterium]